MSVKSILSLALISLANGAIHEPPAGKIFFSAWLDTTDSAPGVKDGDRPVKFNERMGFVASSFQFAQDLPIPAGGFPFPDDQVDETNSRALVILTVYPRPNPWAITDADIDALAKQCARLNNEAKRRLLIRFGPEMNGNWNFWGQQPTQFRALWIRVYNAVKAVASDTGFIWAPSSGNGYPYTTVRPSAADLQLMDTNRDGVVNSQDDPYAPYYPGDEYVDWVGASIYTYGTTFPWSDNISAPPGKFDEILNDNNFYQDYAIAKNKPYMIAETAAAFHTNTPLGPGVGELETKRSWWRQYLTNATFLSTHPQLKLICLFEFMKFEETFADGTPSLRDFRISNKTEIREAFLQDFSSVRQFYLLGDINDTPVPKDNTGATRARSASSMVTVSWAVLATIMVTALSM